MRGAEQVAITVNAFLTVAGADPRGLGYAISRRDLSEGEAEVRGGP